MRIYEIIGAFLCNQFYTLYFYRYLRVLGTHSWQFLYTRIGGSSKIKLSYLYKIWIDILRFCDIDTLERYGFLARFFKVNVFFLWLFLTSKLWFIDVKISPLNENFVWRWVKKKSENKRSQRIVLACFIGFSNVCMYIFRVFCVWRLPTVVLLFMKLKCN